MKNFALIVLAALSISPAAFACERYAAEVIAPVVSVRLAGNNSCLAYVDFNRAEIYSPDRLCPLSRGTILEKGVEVGVTANGSCRLTAGATLARTLELGADGVIR